MQNENTIDYGPLTALIGTWKGNKGKDLSPEPDGTEHNEFYETIVFTAADDLANAEEEKLSAVHYVQKVRRITNDKVLHQETGYWMWEQGTDKVMHSLTIPRGICVLAGGDFTQEREKIIFNVKAEVGNQQWPIIQTTFLQQKAKVESYKQQVTLFDNTLHYTQTMMLDIYGRTFEHTDSSTLVKVVE